MLPPPAKATYLSGRSQLRRRGGGDGGGDGGGGDGGGDGGGGDGAKVTV